MNARTLSCLVALALFTALAPSSEAAQQCRPFNRTGVIHKVTYQLQELCGEVKLVGSDILHIDHPMVRFDNHPGFGVFGRKTMSFQDETEAAGKAICKALSADYMEGSVRTGPIDIDAVALSITDANRFRVKEHSGWSMVREVRTLSCSLPHPANVN